MSKFNTPTPTAPKTTNLAGGEAFVMSDKLKLVSILLTSFVADKFYKSANTEMKDLRDLIASIKDKKFVAQASIFARDKFNMRSISHVTAAEIAKFAAGNDWAKAYYDKIVVRPDDMTEILSYYFANCSTNGNVANSIKKGFAKAFDKFDEYQLAKYRMEGKAVSLVDVVNLVHPVPVEKNALALSKLIKGELKSADTWESKLSAAGQEAGSAEEKADLKKDAWIDLVKNKKIGYMALMRNLRNILTQAPEIVAETCQTLTNEKLVKSSRILPFRFLTAIEEVNKIGGPASRDVVNALNRAIEISLVNVPRYDGSTLVVFDRSGSMNGKPTQIGSLFAAALAKTNNADVVTFGSAAQYMNNLNYGDSVFTLAAKLAEPRMGGTNYHSIFALLTKKYDRIIILSDGEAWMGWKNAKTSYDTYVNRIGGPAPKIYNFDLQGTGTLQFPENKVYFLSGFSDQVFEIMGLLEQDRQALVHAIEAVEI